MKSVNEIKEIADESHKRPGTVTTRAICDVLIGITEHLEAQARPETYEITDIKFGGGPHPVVTATKTEESIRREGRIEALQWAKCESLASIVAAINRLKEGGELE
jgi:hypothetical protein